MKRFVTRALIVVAATFGIMFAQIAPASAATPPPAPLTASWWQQFVRSNSLDRCDLGTDDIVFLAGTTGQPVPPRSCTTNKTTFLVPLINVECSRAEGDGGTPEKLRACAKDFADHFANLKLVVDGNAETDFSNLRVQAESTFTATKGNVFGVPPARNSIFAADGYWALITLEPGEHTITFGGSYVPVAGQPPAFTTEVTYNLTVQT
jgi:hypothetical protein